ncbi:MAG: radical SAM protein [Prevotella sp.]|nr:radical SAM protein [Prevotella sp.]
MLIMITSRCHMECPHCMQDAGPGGRHMTDETFDEVMDFCREAQPWVVSLTGGEPTEHPRWREMARELLALPSVKILTILTNGAWIDDTKERLKMARLIRDGKSHGKKLMVQVYSHPRYYQDHEWTVEHEQQFRAIGCQPNFTDPIFMQDLGRARENCQEETGASDHVPSCINSHLLAVQARSLQHFLLMAAQAGKFCRPLIDPDGAVHMSESWLCPAVARVSDGAPEVFRQMRRSRPCRGCRLYRNFEQLHPKELQVLENPILMKL